jgi:hypothetical protein
MKTSFVAAAQSSLEARRTHQEQPSFFLLHPLAHRSSGRNDGGLREKRGGADVELESGRNLRRGMRQIGSKKKKATTRTHPT